MRTAVRHPEYRYRVRPVSTGQVINERTGVSLGFMISALGTVALLAALGGTAHYRIGANEEDQKELREEQKEVRAKVEKGQADQQAAAQLAATLLERVANLQKSMDRLERRLGPRTTRGEE